MLAYLDHLEARDELDLESATEFLVLIAALLELKSRLMLPRRGDRRARRARARRGGRGAAGADARASALPRRRRAPGGAPRGRAGRAATAPRRSRRALRRAPLEHGRAGLRPRACWARRSAGCCGRRRRSTCATSRCRASSLRRAARRPAQAAAPRHVLVRRGRRGRRPHDRRGDALRAAGALQARRGRLGAGRAVRPDHRARRARPRPPSGRSADASSSASSRRCCSSRPTPCRSRSSPTRCGSTRTRSRPGCARSRCRSTAAALVLRELAGGLTLGSHPDAEEAARRLLARPRTPPLTPAQAETLAIVAYLQPVSRPEIARIRGVASESATTALRRARSDRGGRALAVRRRPLPHDAAVPEAVRPDVGRRAAGPRPVGPQPGGAGRAARPTAEGRRGALRHRAPAVACLTGHAGHRILIRSSRAPARARVRSRHRTATRR